MKISALHIGMNVRHPQYGLGVVKKLDEHTAEVRFSDVLRSVDPDAAELVAAEPQAAISGLEVPLKQFVDATVEAAVKKLGWKSRPRWWSNSACAGMTADW